jgi:hypothetical protein
MFLHSGRIERVVWVGSRDIADDMFAVLGLWDRGLWSTQPGGTGLWAAQVACFRFGVPGSLALFMRLGRRGVSERLLLVAVALRVASPPPTHVHYAPAGHDPSAGHSLAVEHDADPDFREQNVNYWIIL